MLPQVQASDETGPISRTTIYVNPNFNKTAPKSVAPHLNPLFLQRIHMNPQFLQKKLLEQEWRQMKEQSSTAASTKLENSRTIISKSGMRLVREPLVQNTSAKINPPVVLPQVARQPLLKLTKRKLVRRAVTPSAPSPAQIARVSIGKYKVDNRRTPSKASSASMTKVRRRAFVGRYALLRSTSQQNSTKAKNSNSSSMRSSLSSNRKLELLNINGVLYKSTRNKLQRKDATTTASVTLLRGKDKLESSTPTIKKGLSGRTLFVRGTKFVLDAQGYKLTRLPSLASAASSNSLDSRYPRTPTKQWQRLDIGGLTYIASKTQNVFVRTGNHLAMSHLNNAKQRSLQLLTRRLVKSNVPCAIFQRVGKCVAFERGRCSKVHDKLQVTICPRFLRGECTNSSCLLSHHVSFFKMPVCKFFLQGLCVRSDCPYLHKKLSQKAEICEEFLRGFCNLAEQCQKRHEFLCPIFERTGKCEVSNCVHCKSKKRRDQIKAATSRPTKTSKKKTDSSRDREENAEPTMRYFNGNSAMEDETSLPPPPMDDDVTIDDADDTNALPLSLRAARPKVGTLPAFIPLS